jgi:NADPH:quinone reductase-like Zn-dependent oxidoreductase
VGRGLDFVHDCIGRDTFMKSIECICRRGMTEAYGNESRKADPLLVASEKKSFS